MQRQDTMGRRRFGAVNWIGLGALVAREVRRFTSIYPQTVLAPLLTSALFMLVFLLAFGERRGDVAGIGFAAFLAPGILMMSVIQNAGHGIDAFSSLQVRDSIVSQNGGNGIEALGESLATGTMA